MKKSYVVFPILAVLILTACSSDHTSQAVKHDSHDPKTVKTSSSQSVTATSSVNSDHQQASPAPSSSTSASTSSETVVGATGVTVSHSERTEPNPPMDEETAKSLLIDRTEPNPPMDEETAKRLLIAPTGGQRVTLSITPQLQQVHNYCAPTTVSMMLSSRGVHVDQYQLAREMGTYEPFGTHNRDAIRILNRHLFGYEAPIAQQAGYRLATVTSASPEELQLFKERLRQNIADGYPMYYTFDCAKIYPGFRGEHNAIGIGYELTPDGQDIANIYYLDPMPALQDPTYGSLKKVSPQLLLEAMLTCQEPNYGW